MIATLDILMILVYFVIMLCIGIYFSRRQKTSEDFFLANRNLGSFHVVATTFSTLVGAGLVFSVAALSYTYGTSSVWLLIAGLFGYILFAFAAPQIKALGDSMKAITLPELLEKRLDRKCSVTASIITIIIFTGVIAVNFLVAGNILRIAFDVPLALAIALFAVLVIAYSLLGGFKAVVWTDVFQMVWMFAGISILFLIILKSAGGFGALSSLPADYLNPFGMSPALIIGLFLTLPLMYFASQDLFQRVYASKDKGTAKRSMFTMGVPLLLFGSVVVLIGIFARVLFPEIVPDQVVAVATVSLVPVGLIGFILASYLAIANSTADSELLTVTSNIRRDFYKPAQRKESGPDVISKNRLVLVLVGIFALLMAIFVPSIVNIFFQIASWFGILGITIVSALFWKRVTSKGALVSMILGFGCATTYSAVTGDFEGAMLAGLIPAAVSIVAVSLLTKSDTTAKVL